MSKRDHQPEQFDFTLDAVTLAPRLLGAIITTCFDGNLTSGRIVEVEAYRQDEPASHCYRGETRRNASMFRDGGHLYVYFSYGMHHSANIVAGNEGFGEGVLLRGIEPIDGIDVIRRRRGDRVKDRNLANGPAKLTVALGIGPDLDGADLRSKNAPLGLAPPPTPIDPQRITTTPRIGISKAVDLPWRWLLTTPTPEANH